MQVLPDPFDYHSNPRAGPDGDLEDERQLLVEEQKLCRIRARKFSVETSRRLRALEERRKQWDKQEQQLRQDILQQRKQQLQDATERFQKSHLPPSLRYMQEQRLSPSFFQQYRKPFQGTSDGFQRPRQSLRRFVHNIDDAISHIQGLLSLYTPESPFLSSNSNISRSCIPTPKPPTVSKGSHRQALSAVEAYTRLLQEKSMTCFEESQQTEKAQEKQHDHHTQDGQLSDCCHSESLSSKDSLENEGHNYITTNPERSSSSPLHISESSPPELRKQNNLCPTSDRMSSSPLMFLGHNLSPSTKLQESKPKSQEDSEGPNNKTHASLNKCSTALQSPHLKQETLLDLRQQKVYDNRQLKYPSATGVLLPAKNGNSKDVLFEAPSTPNIFLNDSTTDNASHVGAPQQSENEIYYLSSQKQPSASINNSNEAANSESRSERPVKTTSLQHTGLSHIQSGALKCPEEEVQELPVPAGTPHPGCQNRFFKGILKRPSRYNPGDNTCMYGTEHFIFTKQVALGIRDSVELTRMRAKDVDVNSATKKKLRWFDEVHVDKEDKRQDILRQMNSGSSDTTNNSEDHQQSLSTVSGASRPGPNMTPPASSGYHFTKQAWADVGDQVVCGLERADEVKVPWRSTRPGGPKAPRRERSANAATGPVSLRSRKGAVIRPQSATEVSQIAKPQGKIVAPHPPPRTDPAEDKTPFITRSPYGSNHTSVNCKQTAAGEQTPHKNIPESLFSPLTHPVFRADSTVLYTLLPPSYPSSISEGNAKAAAASGHQETPGCSRRRAMVCSERGLCFDYTPTDEEISQLWHSVRSALSPKDVKAKQRRQPLESGRVVRKACVDQSRQPPGSGNRRFPQPAQTTEQVRSFSSPYNMAFPHEDLESVGQLHLAEEPADGPLDERDLVVAMGTAQTQRPATVHPCNQQHGPSTLPLEDKILSDGPSTREVKVLNYHKLRASSANARSQAQRTF